MDEDLALEVNGQAYRIQCDPSTPLLYILRNDLGLFGAKFGCGLEQCGACKVLVDGEALPTCRAPASSFQRRTIVTIPNICTRSSRRSSTRRPPSAATAFRA